VLNQALSERRAAAVVAYLSSRFGIAPGRLEAVGMGESQPLIRTGDEVNEPRNRRVQVVNIGS
jgi:outer membrane protein OmpA-like peptidoglycan-associated protein